VHLAEDLHHVLHSFDRTKVGDVDQQLLVFAAPPVGSVLISDLLKPLRNDEVGYHIDVGADSQLPNRRPLQGVRYGGDRVAPDDAEPCGFEIVGIVADQGDIRAVQRRHDLEWLRRKDLAS